jgi:hypothetical protein
MSLCSDWEIHKPGDLNPLLGFEIGSVSQVAEPLAGTSFLPGLFTQPGKVRDCTPLNAQISSQPMEAQLMVVEGNQQLSATSGVSGDGSGSNMIVDNVLHYQLQP